MSPVRSRHNLIGAIVVAVGTVIAVAGIVPSDAAQGASSRPNVCPFGCQYRQIADAVRAARSGDTISIGPGTYSGGLVLDRTVSLVGAGPDRTTIVGVGGTSVITIGVYGAAREPRVDLQGLTVSGGRVSTSPQSIPWVGAAGVIAAGGGIEIPPPATTAGTATVHLTDVVVANNEVFPRTSAAVGPPCPDGRPCPYAEADGGGIDNWGDLTLDHSVVRDNTVGTAPGQPMLASDADGAGIMSRQGQLVIRTSQISGNTARAAGANARYADAGGLFVESGSVAIDHDTITGNRASLAAALPASVDLLAIAGGVHIGGAQSGSVSNSLISGNSVVMTNSIGSATAVSGGLHSDIDVLAVADTTVSHNNVDAATIGESTGDAHADSGSGELSGTLRNTRMTDNSVEARSLAGNAEAYAGAAIFGGTALDSQLQGNHIRAEAPHGVASSGGGAFMAGGPLTLTGCLLRGNRVQASGLSGFARGGAIFAELVPNGPPAGPIQLASTVVTDNSAAAARPLVAQGGGIYTTSDYPLTQQASSVTGNVPDDIVRRP